MGIYDTKGETVSVYNTDFMYHFAARCTRSLDRMNIILQDTKEIAHLTVHKDGEIYNVYGSDDGVLDPNHCVKQYIQIEPPFYQDYHVIVRETLLDPTTGTHYWTDTFHELGEWKENTVFQKGLGGFPVWTKPPTQEQQAIARLIATSDSGYNAVKRHIWKHMGSTHDTDMIIRVCVFCRYGYEPDDLTTQTMHNSQCPVIRALIDLGMEWKSLIGDSAVFKDCEDNETWDLMAKRLEEDSYRLSF